MKPLTPAHIAIATGARIHRAVARADSLNQAMQLFEIDHTVRRQAMFLANIGHETMGLVYLREIWGPTPAQRRYERDRAHPWPRDLAESKLPAFAVNRLAWSLGNSQPGDGMRFAGHGDLQTTGRTNHALVRDRLRKRFPGLGVPDLEVQPDELATPRWAALAAGDYCAMKNCNAMADADDFDGYCDLINRGRKTEDEGDSNGFEDRLAIYTRGLAALTL